VRAEAEGVEAVHVARRQGEGEVGGGARERARRHASAYWQRLKTVGLLVGWANSARLGGLGQVSYR
jgi:hypothetical protein